MALQLANQLRSRRLPAPALAREIRRQAGATQRECADELGVHRVTFVRWESGAQRPSGALAERYAALLAELAEVAS